MNEKEICIDGQPTGYRIRDNGEVVGKYGRLLKERYCPSGYVQLALRFNGRYVYVYLHRAVYQAFVGEIPKGIEINHKDGNKLNNDISNLELSTRVENVNHSWEYGLSYKHDPHMKHNIEKELEKEFPKNVIENICKDMENHKLTYYEIAAMYKCKPSMVQNIASGKLWPEISTKYDIAGRFKRRRKMYKERDEMIRKYIDEGLNATEIAKKMGLSFYTVARRLYLMHLKVKNRYGTKGSTTIQIAP